MAPQTEKDKNSTKTNHQTLQRPILEHQEIPCMLLLNFKDDL